MPADSTLFACILLTTSAANLCGRTAYNRPFSKMEKIKNVYQH